MFVSRRVCRVPKSSHEYSLFPNFREIQQSLKSAKSVHAQWAKLLESGADPGRVENAQTELNKALKSIEWDLQDLDQTISIPSYAVRPSLFLSLCVGSSVEVRSSNAGLF